MANSTTKTIWTLFTIIAVSIAVIVLHPILLLIFIAFILTLGLRPPVEWLKKKGVPRTLSVMTMMALALGLLGAAAYFIGPELVTQVRQLVQQAPEKIQQAEEAFGFVLIDDQFMERVFSVLRDASSVIYTATAAIVTAITSFVIIIVLSVYWLIYYDEIKQAFLHAMPKGSKQVAKEVIKNVEKNLQVWAIGQLSLCVVVGVLVWIAYTIIGLPYALPLAALAAILEIIPNFGPTLAAIPAILIGLSISPVMALIVLGAYVFIQIAESYFLTPKIMSRVTHLNPFIVMIAILVGTQVLGLVGTFIAVPLLLLVISIVQGIRTGQKTILEAKETSQH